MSVPAEQNDKWTAAVTVRLIITILMVIIVGFWLVMVAQRLGTAPVTKPDGTIVYDEFGRAKDILIAVLPLLTLALGYWFGAQSADKAEKQADQKAADADAKAKEADDKAKEAAAKAKVLDDQVKAFYKFAAPDVIDKAKAEVEGGGTP